MSEPTPAPAPAEKPVVVNQPSLGRLWTCTIISLSLNGLILALLLLGAVIHHHRMMREHRFAELGGPPPGMPGMNGMPGAGGMPGMMGRPKGPPDPAMMTNNILDHLTSALALTEDQQAKVRPIVEAQVAQIHQEMEAQRAAMQKEMADAREKLKPFLNADQQKKLDAMPLPGEKPPE